MRCVKQLLFFFIFFGSFALAQTSKELVIAGDEKYEQGDFSAAALFYIRAYEKDSANASLAYNAACSFALNKEDQKASLWLEAAFKSGWKDVNGAYWDPDLQSLKDDTTWHRVIAPQLEIGLQTENAPDKKLFYAWEAARSYAIVGNDEKAFFNLNKAMDFGWTRIYDPKATKDLERLKRLPQWEALVEKFKGQRVIGERNFFSGMYMGILFILFFYNLFLYISMRDISLLYYSLLLFAYSQLEAIRTPEFGLYSQDIFVWHNYFDLIGMPFYFFISISMLLHVVFVRSFLNVKTNNPRINKWFIGFIIYFVLQALISLFSSSINTRPFVYFSTMLIYVSTFIFGIICWRKGYRPARFFVIASFSSTLGLVLKITRSLGFIDHNIHFGVFGPDTLGIIIFFALLSFALGDKINILKKEKETAQEKALEVLEEKVTERTSEVVAQKHIIEEKHKEITDSINYAERIQRSFIATKELLDRNFGKLHSGKDNNYFVMFKPKDVVSGDFYWGALLKNGEFAFVTADSTGHGVPGAIMSLLNITSLEKAIEHHTDPADILNETRNTIIERLKNDGSEEGGKDGMDCSLLIFDFKGRVLKVAAANNPVWIVRKKTEAELLEITPDKMPVGKHDKDKLPFTTHSFSLEEGDVIYTLTDGYQDQFGGTSGKKFMSKRLKELLISIYQLPMNEQKKVLETTFKNWVNELEQVDDVTLIGIRI